MSVGHKQILLLLDTLAYTVALFISTMIVMFIYSRVDAHILSTPIQNITPWLLSFALLLPIYILLMTASNMYVYWRRFRDEFLMITIVIFLNITILTFGSSISLYLDDAYSTGFIFLVHILMIPLILGVIWVGIAFATRRIARAFTQYEFVTIIVPTIDDVKARMDIMSSIYDGFNLKYKITNFISLDGSETQKVWVSDTLMVKAHSLLDKHRPRVALVIVDEVMTAGDMESIRIAEASFMETILMHKVTPKGRDDEVTDLAQEITSSVFFLGKGWHSYIRRWIKRGIDLTVVAIVSVVAIPLILVLLVVIMIDSKGAPIYKHRRVGYGGRDLDVFKLRTMYVDSYQKMAEILATNEEVRIEWETYRKLKNDPRVTRVGKIIRKLSLDELPQIANILMGNMSFVGPRPVTQEEIESNYKDKAFYYKMVVPGLTGFWQINGRSIVTYEHRVLMDMAYVQKNSLMLDMLIVVQTPFKLLFSKASSY